MSELSREEVIRKIGDAVKLVGELCSGGRKWTMSVPARPDYDPDLIIGGALDAALRALSQPPDSEAVKVNEDVLDAFLDNQSAGSDLQACLEAAISVYLEGIAK